MLVVWGVLGYALVVSCLVLATHLGTLLASRALGMKLTWFGLRGGASLARLAVSRAAGFLAAWLLAFALLTLGALWAGDRVPTTRVEVLPGGTASRAGVRDGDQVLKVNGVTVQSWDELRDRVGRSAGAAELELERDGQRRSVQVPLGPGSKIGIAPVSEARRLGVSGAVGRALDISIAIVASTVNVVAPDPPQVRGPVGIVKEVSSAPNAGSALSFLALLASYWGWLVLGVLLFELVSLVLFERTHPAAISEEPWRLARLRQALILALLGALAAVSLLALDEVVRLPGPVRALTMLIYGVSVALLPLVLLSAAALTTRGKALALLLASALVPCVMLIAAFGLIGKLKQRLATHGIETTGLRARVRPT